MAERTLIGAVTAVSEGRTVQVCFTVGEGCEKRSHTRHFHKSGNRLKHQDGEYELARGLLYKV